MTADGRRRLRVFFKFGLLVCLPLTGYLWAAAGVSALAIAMSAVCVVMALGAEGLASVAESHLSQLKTIADTEERSFNADVNTRDEKIRQMDRIVETLSNQNHDLRGKLVSIHGEIHRLNEEMPETEPSAVEPAAPSNDKPKQEEASGDVTDITSLRSRR